MTKPTKLDIRMYQVGFGDGFLLTFTYAAGARHVLIDCGSNKQHGFAIDKIAANIVKTCGTDPVAIVVTHRHKDHTSGFDGKAWDLLKTLNVTHVVQPWTEIPNLAANALEPKNVAAVAGLSALQDIVERIVELSGEMPAAMRDELVELAANNTKNPEIVKNLQTWKSKTKYVKYGDTVLDDFLDGVSVHVLGPPTRKDVPSFSYDDDSDEYWGLVPSADALVPQNKHIGPPLETTEKPPVHAFWLKRRLDALCQKRWMEIVTAVDSALNNTSVILAIEVGKETLLFPGDAQLENWQFALKQPKTKQLLAKVTWYKVGHHGSHNATPKSMWGALARKGVDLKTLLSTHTHHSYPDVPQHKLVDELRNKSKLYSTFDEDKIVVDIDSIIL